MRFVLAGMMAAFLLAGLAVAWAGLRELYARLTRRFERAEGVVVGIRTKMLSSRGPRLRPAVACLPTVTFTTRDGRTVTFTSEVGDAEPTRYEIGQPIRVRYDPAGRFRPTLDSWVDVLLPPAVLTIAGGGFLLGAWLVYVGFWDRIAGR